jgi:hypothetical protein
MKGLEIVAPFYKARNLTGCGKDIIDTGFNIWKA